mmetsp:Transcript_89361/g.130739  ORF Transcript_89361/g.130739 Transcript_89361/m.130739 type:complete len:116 (-) Transcript_89361:211-558(-)
MLEIIEQLFGMFAVIGALYASSQMMLVADSSDDMMMFTSLQQAALNVFSYQVLSLLEDAVRLGLSYPDGLISMYRPFRTRHDGAMLLAARILIILARFRSEKCTLEFPPPTPLFC